MFSIFIREYLNPVIKADQRVQHTKSLADFLGELNECAKRTFGGDAQHMINSLLFAKPPPCFKKSLNLAYFENGTYNQIVALRGLENDRELSIRTMTAVPPNKNPQNSEQPKVVCDYSKILAKSLEMDAAKG